MATLDEGVDTARKRLRRELKRVRRANGRLDRKLKAAMKPPLIVAGLRIPRVMAFRVPVFAWLTRKRDFRTGKN